MRIVHIAVGAVLLTVVGTRSDAQPRSAGTGFGETFRVEFEYRRWNPEPISELEVGAFPSKISLTNDLGVERKREDEFRGAVRIVSWLKARGSYLKVDYDTTQTIERDLRYAGVAFPAGSSVETAQSLEYRRIGGEADLWRSPYLVLSVVGEFTRFETDTVLVSPDEGTVSPGPLRIELPTFGLKSRLYLTPRFSGTLEATGMKKESEGVLTNVDASVTFHLSRNLAFSFGYQNSYARVSGTELVREVFRLEGRYFGFTVRF